MSKARADKAMGVIVIEFDQDHLHEAIENMQRFLSAFKRYAPEPVFSSIVHIAIEEVAEAVLKHFEHSPLVEEEVMDES
jgi:hypothetical protein